jgi:hypothetical protein
LGESACDTVLLRRRPANALADGLGREPHLAFLTLNTRTGLHIGPIPANQTTVLQVPAAVHMDENAPTSCQASLFTFGTINAGFSTG